jgi:hypothetical protein
VMIHVGSIMAREQGMFEPPLLTLEFREPPFQFRHLLS